MPQLTLSEARAVCLHPMVTCSSCGDELTAFGPQIPAGSPWSVFLHRALVLGVEPNAPHSEAVWGPDAFHPGYGKGVCAVDGEPWPCRDSWDIHERCDVVTSGGRFHCALPKGHGGKHADIEP